MISFSWKKLHNNSANTIHSFVLWPLNSAPALASTMGVFLAAAGWVDPPPPSPPPPPPTVAGHGWPEMAGGKFGQNQGK